MFKIQYVKIAAAIMLISIIGITEGREKSQKSGTQTRLSKVQTTNMYRAMNINNIFNYYGNNGDGSFNQFSSNNGGYEYPKGSGMTTVFEDGVVWGGFHHRIINANDTRILKVGGSTYRHGLQPGRIISPGTATSLPYADDPTNGSYRIYCVRPDVNTGTPFDSVMEQILQTEEVDLISRYQKISAEEMYNAYVKDWNEWPASYGAPFEDKNNNGNYDPSVDIPGVPGAQQTMWYVANDVNTGLTQNMYGSDPIGIEMQKTIWAYKTEGLVGNMILTRTRLINKSGTAIDSMFISQWADPDLGFYSDDFVGCDSLLNLEYVYNALDNDAVYGDAAPAVGYVFVLGPKVAGAAGDSAIFDGKIYHGYKNLGIYSFNFFTSADSFYFDPQWGSDGTRQFYNLMNGLIGQNGAPYINPVTGKQTRYVLTGDPVTGQGWLDGIIAPPGDRRIVESTGPFIMAAGDTQEVVVATLVGQGDTRISSITALRGNTHKAYDFARGIPVAGIGSVNPIYSVNSIVKLRGSTVVFTGSITNTQWFIAQKPPSSTAHIDVTKPGESSMQVDVAGIYMVAYAVVASNGQKDTAFVSFLAVNNTQPVVSFQTSATHVAIGDTLHLDGSATYDAEGDPLHYTWSVTGNDIIDYPIPYDTLRSSLINGKEAKASYVPVRASTLNISVAVKDSYFVVTAPIQNVIVDPIKTPNVNVTGSYSSNIFPSGGIYGHGAIRVFPDNSVWVGNNSAYFPLNFTNFLQVSQSYVWSYASNFYIGNNLIFIPTNSGVSILQTDGNSNITGSSNIPPIQTVSTTDSIPYDVYYKNSTLFVSNGSAGIYVYNTANPASPSFMNKFSNGEKWRTLCADGNHLYCVNPLTQQLLYADVSNPSNVTMAKTFVARPFTTIKKIGQYFYIYKSDTIGVYDLSNVLTPALKSEIAVPSTLNNKNIIYDVSGDGTTLMVGTAEGVYFYNVSNPFSPAQIGKFITGYEATRVYYDGTHVLANSYGRGLMGGYEGFTLFSKLTGVRNDIMDVLPLEYNLSQNYPNPFNPTTVINYQLPMNNYVTLKVYDVLGREVATLVNEMKKAGSYSMKFQASKLSSGIYFYTLRAGHFVQTKKMTILK